MLDDAISIVFLPVTTQGYDDNLNRYTRVLDDHELERYHRFRVDHARNSFLQTRYMLKTLLAKPLSCAPQDVVLRYSDNGKPFVKNAEGIHFSLSHCKSAIAIALSPVNIGIDAEEINRGERVWQSAAEFINHTAAGEIAKVTCDEQAANIFSLYWTSVEACVKLNDSSIFTERKGMNLAGVCDPHFQGQQGFECNSQYFNTFKQGQDFRVTWVTEVPKKVKIEVWSAE